MNYQAHLYWENHEEFLRELELFDNTVPTWWDDLRRLVIQYGLSTDDFSAAYRFLIERGEPSRYPDFQDDEHT